MIEVRNLAFSFGKKRILRDVSFVVSPGEVVSVVGANGAGKTTLLRDLIRVLSNGNEQYPPQRIAVVDERSEIAVMYQGLPQVSVGRHADVLDSCPKAIGIPMLLRSVNPQIIAVDEITEPEDIRAIASASNCGIHFLATSQYLGTIFPR